ncbi:hypothetical protein D3C81_1843460 [compost metagenome]
MTLRFEGIDGFFIRLFNVITCILYVFRQYGNSEFFFGIKLVTHFIIHHCISRVFFITTADNVIEYSSIFNILRHRPDLIK